MLALGQLVGAECQEEDTDRELVAVSDGPVDGGDDRFDVGGAGLAGDLEADHVRLRGDADLRAGGDAGQVRAVTRAVHGLGGGAHVGREVGAGDEPVAELAGGGDARVDDRDADASAREALAME